MSISMRTNSESWLSQQGLGRIQNVSTSQLAENELNQSRNQAVIQKILYLKIMRFLQTRVNLRPATNRPSTQQGPQFATVEEKRLLQPGRNKILRSRKVNPQGSRKHTVMKSILSIVATHNCDTRRHQEFFPFESRP